ncbi:hypothetical protein PORY_002526 [Pneumocystis oryctolagi]|uniref:Uncharacterized protein n=1 Tax=Pneumocystis oryctolagi TaxID=42067 RepID=A0ACB7C8Z8_9ASCO|nr:hypothetical protein PORY_002526 [Pneumocystis oryctolagi]
MSTSAKLHFHPPTKLHTVLSQVLGASMWFFMLYRMKQDGPGLKHPWETRKKYTFFQTIHNSLHRDNSDHIHKFVNINNSLLNKMFTKNKLNILKLNSILFFHD